MTVPDPTPVRVSSGCVRACAQCHMIGGTRSRRPLFMDALEEWYNSCPCPKTRLCPASDPVYVGAGPEEVEGEEMGDDEAVAAAAAAAATGAGADAGESVKVGRWVRAESRIRRAVAGGDPQLGIRTGQSRFFPRTVDIFLCSALRVAVPLHRDLAWLVCSEDGCFGEWMLRTMPHVSPTACEFDAVR